MTTGCSAKCNKPRGDLVRKTVEIDVSRRLVEVRLARKLLRKLVPSMLL